MEDWKAEIDSQKLDEETLDKNSEFFDIDEDLENEFNRIMSRITDLKIKYQALVNTRSFLNG